MGKGERNKNQISEEKDLLKVNSKKNNKPKREFPVLTVFCLCLLYTSRCV